MQLHKCSIPCFPYIQKELIKKSSAICYIPTYKACLQILLKCRSLLGIRFSYMHASLFFLFCFHALPRYQVCPVGGGCCCDAQSCGDSCGRTGRALCTFTVLKAGGDYHFHQKPWLELICLPRARGRWGILAGSCCSLRKGLLHLLSYPLSL